MQSILYFASSMSSSRPPLSRVWVTAKVGGQNQLVCKWSATPATHPLDASTIDSPAGADDPPALAA